MDKDDSFFLSFWKKKTLSVDQDVLIVEQDQILAVVALIQGPKF